MADRSYGKDNMGNILEGLKIHKILESDGNSTIKKFYVGQKLKVLYQSSNRWGMPAGELVITKIERAPEKKELMDYHKPMYKWDKNCGRVYFDISVNGKTKSSSAILNRTYSRVSTERFLPHKTFYIEMIAGDTMTTMEE